MEEQQGAEGGGAGGDSGNMIVTPDIDMLTETLDASAELGLDENMAVQNNLPDFEAGPSSSVTCGVCLKSLSCKQSLASHMLRKHGVVLEDESRKAHCKYCPYKSSQASVNAHTREAHADLIGFVWPTCPFCQVAYPDEKSLGKHKQKCKSRDKTTTDSQDGNTHICSICSHAFNALKGYLRHMRTSHENEIKETWLPCPFCYLLYPDEQTLNVHRSRSWSCITARQRTIDASLKSSNAEAATNYQCNMCDFTAGTTREFTIHVKECHQDAYEDIPAQDLNQEVNKKRKCDFCAFSTDAKNRLFRHVRINHAAKIADTWIPCPHCSLTYPDMPSVQLHSQKKHGKPIAKQEAAKHINHKSGSKDAKRFKCAHCPRFESVSFAWFLRHVRGQHKEKIKGVWVECPKCNQLFPSRSSMLKHKTHAHKTATPRKSIDNFKKRSPAYMVKDSNGFMSCIFCRKMTVQSKRANNKLFAHIRLHHFDKIKNSWIPCVYCKKLYPDKTHRQQHQYWCPLRKSGVLASVISNGHEEVNDNDIRTRSPERDEDSRKRHSCEVCESPKYSSTNFELYLNHVRDNHPEIVRASWRKCSDCHRCFPTIASLRKHEAEEHRINMEVVETIDSGESGGDSEEIEIIEQHAQSSQDVPEGKNFACKFCEFYGDSKLALLKHCREEHTCVQLIWARCPRCHEVFPSKGDLKSHEANCQGDTKCKYCSYMGLLDTWLTHPSLTEDGETSWNDWTQCDTCFLRFPDYEKAYFATHKTNCQAPKNDGPCRANCFFNRHKPHCDLVARKECPGPPGWSCPNLAVYTEKLVTLYLNQQLKNKAANQSKDDYQPCRWCGWKFPNASQLRSHEVNNCRYRSQIQMKAKGRHSCQLCPNYSGDAKNGLYSHMRLEHSDFIENSWQPCPQCKKRYPNIGAIKNHLGKCPANQDGDGINMSSEETFTDGDKEEANIDNENDQCQQRPKTRYRKSKEKVETFKCDFCNFEANFKSWITTHIRGVHAEQIKGVWTECGKSGCGMLFPPTRKDLLLKHRNACEDNKCSYCQDFRAENAIKLRHHIRQKHMDKIKDDWLPCRWCSMLFPDTPRLRNHEHNNCKFKGRKKDKKFGCRFCGNFTTNGKGSLYSHIRETHPTRISTWLKCLKCGVKYPTDYVMRKHMKKCKAEGKKRSQKTRNPFDENSEEQSCQFCTSFVTRSPKKLFDHLKEVHPKEISDPKTIAFPPNRQARSVAAVQVASIPEEEQPNLTENTATSDAPKAPESDTFISSTTTPANQPVPQGPSNQNSGMKTCTICQDFTAKSMSVIYKHARENHPETVSTTWKACPKCTKRFPDDAVLLRHRQNHCDLSGARKFARRNSDDAKEAGDEILIDQVIDTSTKEKYECKHCPEEGRYATSSLELFTQHTNTKHPEVVEETWCPCRDCEEHFPDFQALRDHQCSAKTYGDQEAFNCEYCEFKSTSTMALTTHIQTFHVGLIRDEWSKCSKCKQFYPDEKSVKLHKIKCNGSSDIKSRMAKAKKAVKEDRMCEFCHEECPSYVARLRHAKRTHQLLVNENWDPCHLCGRMYPNKSLLTAHLNTYKHVLGGQAASSAASNTDVNSEYSASSTATPVLVVDISKSSMAEEEKKKRPQNQRVDEQDENPARAEVEPNSYKIWLTPINCDIPTEDRKNVKQFKPMEQDIDLDYDDGEIKELPNENDYRLTTTIKNSVPENSSL